MVGLSRGCASAGTSRLHQHASLAYFKDVTFYRQPPHAERNEIHVTVTTHNAVDYRIDFVFESPIPFRLVWNPQLKTIYTLYLRGYFRRLLSLIECYVQTIVYTRVALGIRKIYLVYIGDSLSFDYCLIFLWVHSPLFVCCS